MKACLKHNHHSAGSSAASSPPSSPFTDDSDAARVRKCVQFCAETCNQIFVADEWDRSPADVTPRLTYHDMLELKEIQRSLPRAEQPIDPEPEAEPEPEFLLNADIDTDVDHHRVRPQRQYLRGVPIGLLPLLPRQAPPRTGPPIARLAAQPSVLPKSTFGSQSHHTPNNPPAPTSSSEPISPSVTHPPSSPKSSVPETRPSPAISTTSLPPPPTPRTMSPSERLGAKFQFLPLLDSVTPPPEPSSETAAPQDHQHDADLPTPVANPSTDKFQPPTPISSSPSPPSPPPKSPSPSYFSLPLTHSCSSSSDTPTHSPTLTAVTASSSAISTPALSHSALPPSLATADDFDFDGADLVPSSFPPLADVIGGSTPSPSIDDDYGLPLGALNTRNLNMHTYTHPSLAGLPSPHLKALPSPALMPPSPFSLYPPSPPLDVISEDAPAGLSRRRSSLRTYFGDSDIEHSEHSDTEAEEQEEQEHVHVAKSIIEMLGSTRRGQTAKGSSTSHSGSGSASGSATGSTVSSAAHTDTETSDTDVDEEAAEPEFEGKARTVQVAVTLVEEIHAL